MKIDTGIVGCRLLSSAKEYTVQHRIPRVLALSSQLATSNIKTSIECILECERLKAPLLVLGAYFSVSVESKAR
jgi:hypothetical protein